MVLVLALFITLFIHASPSEAQNVWVNIYGTVTYDDTPLCAMVLANGQYMFTCGDNPGFWDLEVPVDSNGAITLHGFCSRFSPFKVVLFPEQAQDYKINMTRAPSVIRETEIDIHTEPGIINPNWIRIWGTVTYNGQDVCAMVLANGQSMFSCPPDNSGVFDLEVPLDPDTGQITLQVFAAGFAPYKVTVSRFSGQIIDDITLQWDANTEPDLAGYRIYYDPSHGYPYQGSCALEGASPIEMDPYYDDENPDPAVVEYTLHDFPDGTYYFAVTAFNNEVPPLETMYSNEVAAIIE